MEHMIENQFLLISNLQKTTICFFFCEFELWLQSHEFRVWLERIFIIEHYVNYNVTIT